MDAESRDHAALWWIPVGAGGTLVAKTSSWWELVAARRERRAPQQLVHAALELCTGGTRYVIEMTPQWGQPPEASGVVATGPVGCRALGRFRLFRYEVRAWPEGILPDRGYAVVPAIDIALSGDHARQVLTVLPEVPLHTWGRTVAATGDMWNSNSLIAWTLSRVGIDAEALAPPAGCRAPGWEAGIATATRHGHSDAGS